ncbi:MAG: hypothetical protein LBT96_01625 [Campylobacteraceae bacterium]|jgi:hypothetical protein|nr:hypothetical protein [Campylobacteraceae bacterium]
MALPVFIAGIAIGGLAVVAFNNKAKITQEIKQNIQKAKKLAEDSLQKFKEPQKDIKKKGAAKKVNKPRARKPRVAKEAANVTDA